MSTLTRTKSTASGAFESGSDVAYTLYDANGAVVSTGSGTELDESGIFYASFSWASTFRGMLVWTDGAKYANEAINEEVLSATATSVTRLLATAAGVYDTGATVTWTLYDADAVISQTGSGTELGTTGIYYANITWSRNFQGLILWSDGTKTANETVSEAANTTGGYPTEADVANLFATLNLTVPVTADLAGACQAAADAWEQDTNFVPFLASGAEETRYFDPPGPLTPNGYRGGHKLLNLRDYHCGLLSVTSLRIGLTADDRTGTLLTEGVDFWLWPRGADAEGRPFTGIEFRQAWWGEANSIQIVGPFGFASTLKQLYWNAILKRAGMEVLAEFQYRQNAGAQRVKQGPVEYSYDPKLLLFLPDRWQAFYESAVADVCRSSYTLA